MRILISLVFCTIGLASLHAQEFKLGFKGGVNFIDINPDNFNGETAYQTIKADDQGLGYHAGAFGRGTFGSFTVQTELVFTHLDQTLTAKADDQRNDENLQITFNRFDIPLLMGVELGPFHAMAGPVASLNLTSSSDIFDNSLQDESWGYQLAAGIDLGRVTLGVKYEGPFTDTAKRLVIENSSFKTDTRVEQFIASIYIDLL